jgi:MoaA/NifB/PqqE/SkfB family radical SAM enzyme
MHTFDRKLNHLHRRVAVHLVGDDYARTDGRARLSPEWLVLCINNFCNLKCRMCDVGLGDHGTMFWANLIGDDPRNMTLDLLNTILEQARAFRPRPAVGLAFTEPMIHPKIVDFCRTIVAQGFYCEMTSNGTMLPRHAERLVESGLDDLVISVDGPPEIHDRVRGRAGTFEQLYSGLERLNAAKRRMKRTRPSVRFSFTITDANYDHILEFVQAVEPLAPAQIMISHLNFISDRMAEAHNAQYNGDWRVVRSNLGDIQPEQMPVVELWEELQRVKAYARDRSGDRAQRFPLVSITPDVSNPDMLQTYYRDHLTFAGGRNCTDPWKLMMIKTDGTVIPAHGRCYNFPVGNMTEQALPDIWNSPRFVEFRSTLKGAGGTLPACARCCGVIGKKPD